MDELIFLEVPFDEKDQVKLLGAKWHSDRRKWFVSSDVDKTLFEQWIPDCETEASLKAISPFYLVESKERCWKCNKHSQVITFASYGYIEDDETCNGPVMFSYIAFLPPRLKMFLEQNYKYYYIDYSNTTKSFYYINHCEHCKATLGDFYMHSEPEGAFFPIDSVMASKLNVVKLKTDGFVKLSASISFGVIEHVFENAKHSTYKP